jgi:hypothetical protein
MLKSASVRLPGSHGLRAARACPPAIHVRALYRTSSSALINMHLQGGGPDPLPEAISLRSRTSGSALERNPHDRAPILQGVSRRPVFCSICPARPYSLWGLTSLTRPDAGRSIYSTLPANSPQQVLRWWAPDRMDRGLVHPPFFLLLLLPLPPCMPCHRANRRHPHRVWHQDLSPMQPRRR